MKSYLRPRTSTPRSAVRGPIATLVSQTSDLVSKAKVLKTLRNPEKGGNCPRILSPRRQRILSLNETDTLSERVERYAVTTGIERSSERVVVRRKTGQEGRDPETPDWRSRDPERSVRPRDLSFLGFKRKRNAHFYCKGGTSVLICSLKAPYLPSTTVSCLSG